MATVPAMRAWVAAITLTQQALQKAGYQAELGVDHYYASAAARMAGATITQAAREAASCD